jgi:predicted dehydrogenase
MNFLIIGLGNFGEKYVNILNNLDKNYKIYILRHSKNKNYNKELKIEKIFYSLEDTDEIIFDAVFITNPSTLHVETANYFIKKNISCMIEKPISINYLEGTSILKSNNCQIQVGYLLRYSELFNYLKNHEMYIGNVQLIKINVGQYLPDWRKCDYRDCVSSKKEQGGGVLLELSHDINYLLGFLNIREYKIKSFSGKISDLEINVEDSAFIILEIILNNGKKVLVNINMDMIDHDSNRSCRLIGEKGTLVCDFISKEVKINSENFNINQKVDININLLEKQTVDFISKVKTKSYDNKSINDSLETLKIIDLIKSENNL